jgi:peptidoglycan/LPS O-acetylase OafA/YrhL
VRLAEGAAESASTGDNRLMLSRAPSLAARFDPRDNALNALRLLFASLVLVDHAWILGGFSKDDPSLGGLSLGGWSVGAFFAISGFLITRSREHSDLSGFLWRRMLRIFPGLWACLAVIVAVFLPLALAENGNWSRVAPASIARFVAENAFLTDRGYGIAGSLRGSPYPLSWDGSLWTLMYEFGCYLAVAVFFGRLLRGRMRATGAVVALVACTAITLAHDDGGVAVPYTAATAAFFGAFFFAGAVVLEFADRIPAAWPVALACGAVLVVAGALDHVSTMAPLPLAGLVLLGGATLPIGRIGRRNDISYGIYIYAFPVQQLLAVYGAQRYGVWWYIVFGFLGTIPLACASWFFVEQPALGLKRRRPPWLRAPRAATAPADVPAAS